MRGWFWGLAIGLWLAAGSMALVLSLTQKPWPVLDLTFVVEFAISGGLAAVFALLGLGEIKKEGDRVREKRGDRE